MNMGERLNDQEDRLCKGCGSEYDVSDQQIARFMAALAAHPEQCVSEAVYRERLEICSECPHLLHGHTCRVCGCIVQIRAKLKRNECPLPASPGWQQVMD